MKHIFKTVFAVALIMTASNSYAADCADPKAFVTTVKDDVLNVLNSQASASDKRSQLDAKFRTVADTQWMGKFVMGRNYSKLTPEQQTEYAAVYTDYLSASYVDKFRQYNGETITVDNSKPLNDDFNVDTTINRKDKASVNVAYRVRKAEGCFKVEDIIAEGVSLINTQRQDFNSVFNSKGYDGLIDVLKKKTNQLNSGD